MIEHARTARRLAPAALAALAACGGEERPPERAGGGGGAAGAPAAEGTLRIGLPTGKTSFANTDVVVADKQGFFREQGLDVEFTNFGSGLKSVQAVIGGGADIAGASIEPVIAAAAQRQPVRIIGAYADRLTVNMVTPKSIAEPEDLEGQPIGIQDVGAFREIMARYILQRADLTPDDVEYRPVQTTGYIGALLAGQIKGAILQQEQTFAVQQQEPDMHVLVDLYDVQPRYFYGTYFAKTDWLESNSEQAVAFLTALTRAHRWMYDNSDETVEIAMETTGYDKEAVTKAYDILLRRNKVFPVDDGLDRERLQYTIDQMEQLGVISGEAPELDEVIDRGPADEAIANLGSMSERGQSG
jgi:NitT/TauT family transport system substrate-binding protein